MTQNQLLAAKERDAVKRSITFDTAIAIRRLLDEARLAYGAKEFDEQSVEESITELALDPE